MPGNFKTMVSILIRLFDLLFALIGLVLLSPVFIFLFIIGLFDTGSPLFIQQRVGRNEKPFNLVKFRTMTVGTPSAGSHEVGTAYITKFGKFLRASKLDELPQLWNVFWGQMSLVGPRPNLPNQTELISCRRAQGVYMAKPGITGLAQVQNIDMSTPDLLSKVDAKMLMGLDLHSYFKFILLTVSGSGKGDAAIKSKK